MPSDDEDADFEPDDEDDSAAVPKGVVIDDSFDWEGDRPPNVPFADTVIYETHVKGFTKRHPEIREDLRGTYAGLASEPAIEYLKDLGVTAVELLPVHQICDESFLYERGLANYWGYSTIGYLAPHSEYAATGRRGEQVREFKGMVKALHQHGIEVILDVVYNHTAEGNHLGPMLSFKGVDNTAYYRLMPDDPRFYMDFTGTGNSLNPVHPSVLRLIMDSLRYFVTECHVDGFRFDLASALARELYDVDRLSAFFDTIHQDPVLSQVKLIAEPWDVGPGRLPGGQLPDPVVGVERRLPRLDARLLAGHRPASVNLPSAWRARRTCTSQTAANRSPRSTSSPRTMASPCATSSPTTRSTTRPTSRTTRTGPTTTARGTAASRARPMIRGHPRAARAPAAQLPDHAVRLPGDADAARRRRAQPQPRAATTTAGARTPSSPGMTGARIPTRSACGVFTERLIRLRREHCTFRRESFLRGQAVNGSPLPDVWWFRADGRKMTSKDWEHGEAVLGMFLNGEAILKPGPHGEEIEDDSFVLLFNAHAEDRQFKLPRRRMGARWELELTTADPEAQAGQRRATKRRP